MSRGRDLQQEYDIYVFHRLPSGKWRKGKRVAVSYDGDHTTAIKTFAERNGIERGLVGMYPFAHDPAAPEVRYFVEDISGP